MNSDWKIEEPDGIGTYWVWRKDFIDMFMINIYLEFMKYDFTDPMDGSMFGSCKDILNTYVIPLEEPHRKFKNDEYESVGLEKPYTIFSPMKKYTIKNNEPVFSEEWKSFFENTYVMEIISPDKPVEVK